MYKKKLWKPIMAGTLALTMLVTPIGTVSTVSAAEMETAGTEVLVETFAEDTEEEDTAEMETTEEAIPETTSAEIETGEEAEADQPEVTDAPEADTAEGDILLDEAHFPDATFRDYLSANVDTNGDGTLSKAERDACTSINVNEKNIGSMTGVEYFTELTELRCAGNGLTSLDVSANTKLTMLMCYQNELTSLDVKANTLLTNFNCRSNNLTSLDVSMNTELTILQCHSNQLTSLDVSTNTKLTMLMCYDNELTSLNVSTNSELQILRCYMNNLTSLNVSANTELTELRCSSNQLTSLNVSANTKLVKFWCSSNRLTSLDVGANTELTDLYCYSNQLMTLDVSANTKLETLDCRSNRLSSLDVSANVELVYLYCNNNQLTSLDMSANTKLEYLECYNNQLESLDVSTNTKLINLYCNNNQLESLNVSANTKLIVLECYDNQLESLNVSDHTELYRIDCQNNELTSLNVSGDTSLQEINCNNNQLTSLDTSTNTWLTELSCDNNNLTSLDVSANDKLATLKCSNNVYYVNLEDERKYDLSTLPGSGPATWKMSDITGGTLSGTILTFNEGSDTVTYNYGCKDKVTMIKVFTIKEFKAVQTITLTSASVLKGRTLQLNATVAPSDASIQKLNWTSSDKNIATVSKDGLVTAKELGTTTITATAKDGSGVVATCEVTVTNPVTMITLDKTSTSVLKGNTVQLNATVAPEDATDRTVEWTTSDTNIAAVSPDGLVTAVEGGTATITCTAKDGSGVKATCEVTVKVLVSKIALNKTAASVFKGKTLQLKATVTPTNATDKSVTWKSSNTKVATVSSSGKVTAKALGTATITCTAKDGSGVKATCKVTVKNPVTKIKLNKTQATLSPKETVQLKATVTPTNASNKSVTWKSSNTKVATVSSSGKVTAKKAGTATITCTAKDGSGKKATCKITVYTNTEAFVARIYTKALSRTAEADGLKYWTEEINSGRKTPVQVAESFFFAPEFTNKNLSDTEYVKVLYRTFMGREYDQGGLDYWLSRLAKGESRRSVLESFAGCQEFKDIVKSFGL